ncbi:MAG: transposase, partial [Lentisphaerota bacterium]
MKFNELLDKAATPVSAYRKVIFKTIIVAFCAGGSPGRISAIFRRFALMMAGKATIKKFYNFLNSGKLPWDALWRVLAGLIGDPSVGGRLLIALDDTLYGKTGKKIAGCATHFDHAAKKNSSKWIFGQCRVLAGLLLFGHGRWA